MPIYEYRCQSCDNEIEVLVRSGKEPESCPACEGKLARKISRAGVIFKGSGFYVTDSRGSSSGGGDKKAKSGSTDSKPSEGKSESSGSTTESKSTSADSSASTASKTESSTKSSDKS
jgi:putative FmdB family regulatory protein